MQYASLSRHRWPPFDPWSASWLQTFNTNGAIQWPIFNFRLDPCDSYWWTCPIACGHVHQYFTQQHRWIKKNPPHCQTLVYYEKNPPANELLFINWIDSQPPPTQLSLVAVGAHLLCRLTTCLRIVNIHIPCALPLPSPPHYSLWDGSKRKMYPNRV